jgi:hypothetical protein
LIDIQFSSPQPTGDALLTGVRRQHAARGWLALGDRAYGVIFAMGNVAVGGIAVGGLLSVGVIALGGITVGGLAIGGLSLGVLAFGGLSGGVFALGGMAMGWMAFGGGAVAWRAAKGGGAWAHDFAIGGSATAAQANDHAAEAFIGNHWFFDLADRVTAVMGHLHGRTAPLVFIAVALFVCAFLPLAYRRREA